MITFTIPILGVALLAAAFIFWLWIAYDSGRDTGWIECFDELHGLELRRCTLCGVPEVIDDRTPIPCYDGEHHVYPTYPEWEGRP